MDCEEVLGKWNEVVELVFSLHTADEDTAVEEFLPIFIERMQSIHKLSGEIRDEVINTIAARDDPQDLG